MCENCKESLGESIDILEKLYKYITPISTFGQKIGLETSSKEDYIHICNSLKNIKDNRYKIVSSFKELEKEHESNKILIVLFPTSWKEWNEATSFYLTAEEDQIIFILDNSPECYYSLTDESWEIDRNGNIKSVFSNIF